MQDHTNSKITLHNAIYQSKIFVNKYNTAGSRSVYFHMFRKRCSANFEKTTESVWKCHQSLRNIPVKKFNFSKVAGLQPATLLKINSLSGVFRLQLYEK